MFVRMLATAALVAILFTASIAVVPRAGAAVPDPALGPYPYVIVTGQSLADLFLPLAKWRTRTGTRAIIRTIESIRADYPSAYDDAERVRRFLQDARAAWGTHWVLIGGDTDVIPIREALLRDPLGTHGVPTDGYYACLDGTWDADGDHVYGEIPVWGGTDDDQVDMTPDVYVGRAPVSSRDETRRFVDRTMAYERTPIPDLATNVLSMAQMFSFGIDMGEIAERAMPPVVDDPNVHVARLYENTTNPSFPPPVYPETRVSVRDSLSRGYGFVLGLGSGSSTLFTVTNEQVPFVDHYLTVDDVLGLTNAPRLGHVYLMTSGVNRVTEPTSVGEAFLKSTTGGAVTVIAPTDVEFLTPLSSIMVEYIRLIFGVGIATVGEAFVAQMGVLQPEQNAMLVLGELLLGDPRLPVHTQAPVVLAVEHAATLAPDAATIDAQVTRGGVPLADAWVTACVDDHPVSALSDAGGWVHLPIEPPDAGQVALTVTARNSVPYEADIPVQSAPVGVGAGAITRFALDRPHPNPAAATASLRLAIPDAFAGERLEVVVYDAAGRRVRTIEAARATPGVRGLTWDLTDDRGAAVRNGVYLVSASGGDQRITRSVMVLR